MMLVVQLLAGLVCLIHVYIFLLETVLFKKRGAKVFGIPKAEVEMRAVAMSNQGCYNGFLALALLLGLVIPNPAIANAFLGYGFACVAIAGIWGAVTVMMRILYIQTVPAALGLVAMYIALHT
jgi:putative membrane protein